MSSSTSSEPLAHPGDDHAIPTYESHSSFEVLKQRIRHHYELASDYYYSLWGQHIHHAYFINEADTKDDGQVNLINLLLELSQLQQGSSVLDVGCGIGGTSRHLARELGSSVTGITISGRQVQLANKLTASDVQSVNGADPPAAAVDGDGFTGLGAKGGRVCFAELDAEKMEGHFPPQSFDAVWISEALSHFPDKALFFRNAARVLRAGRGRLVIADWFKADHLSQEVHERDIQPIEDGMLLPPLCTQQEYVKLATDAGLEVFQAPKDISAAVAKTWDISWSLISSPSLWAFAIAQGRDGLAFLQAFRAMRRGYANGTFRYAVMVFAKP